MNWLPHDGYDYGCRLSLGGLSVELIFQSPPADPDRVRVRINEFDGPSDSEHLVAEMTAEDGDRDWEAFYGLYQSASKEAFHWDRVLTELQTAVSRAGRIGRSAEEETAPVRR